MNNKLKLFLLITVSITVGFFSSFSLSQIQLKPLEVKSDIEDQKGFFDDVLEKVKKEYVEEKSDKELYEMAADGFLKSLDPHSSYLSEDGFKEMQVQTKGEFGGLGIEITMEFQLVKIVGAIEETPAFEAGIKSGDYISKIDGKTVIGLSIEGVVKKLRGKPRTEVKLTILRKGEKAPLEKTLKRAIIKVKAVRSSKINGDIAYVKINTFSEQASLGVEKELKKLKAEIGDKNFKGLVLDLRNNPGGLLDQAISVSETFLDKDKTIVSIRGRNKDRAVYYKDEENEKLIADFPIVVLINAGSASASEIVAGALQDNKRAIILGVKSFGKGSVQTIIPLSKNNGALRLTTSLYYTPSGKSIQAHGIDPDIIAEEAKIEKSIDPLRDSEADLRGHIEVQIEEEIESAKKEQLKDDGFKLYETDYQLARAVDLIRGISVSKGIKK